MFLGVHLSIFFQFLFVFSRQQKSVRILLAKSITLTWSSCLASSILPWYSWQCFPHFIPAFLVIGQMSLPKEEGASPDA